MHRGRGRGRPTPAPVPTRDAAPSKGFEDPAIQSFATKSHDRPAAAAPPKVFAPPEAIDALDNLFDKYETDCDYEAAEGTEPVEPKYDSVGAATAMLLGAMKK